MSIVSRGFRGRRRDEAQADRVPPGQYVVHDFPANGWRMRELAEGIYYTVVNGQVLLEKGSHTGTYPGQVLHNAMYNARA